MECVGAPVYNQEGQVLGAISASSLYKPTEDYDALGVVVKKQADEISRLLGYMENHTGLSTIDPGGDEQEKP